MRPGIALKRDSRDGIAPKLPGLFCIGRTHD